MNIHEKFDKAIKNNHLLLSNALIGKKSESMICITDSSPVEHEMNVKVRNKNLINIDAMLNNQLTKEDGYYQLTRTTSSQLSGYFYLSIPANTPITFSGELIEYTGTHPSWLRAELLYKSGNKTYLGLRNDVNASDYKKFTATTSDEVVRIRLYIEGTNPVGSYSRFKNIQLEIGSTATSYAPYINDFNCILPEGVDDIALAETAKVVAIGKNILDVANTPMYGNHHINNTKTWTWEKTETGIKFIVLQDFNMRYARNGYLICPIDMVREKTITVSFNRIGKVPGEYVYTIAAGDSEFTNDYTYIGSDVTNPKVYKSMRYSTLVNGYAECTFTVPADETRKYLYLNIYPAYETDLVAGDVIEYSDIQVEINDTATEYEPYKKPFYYDIEADNSVKYVMGKGEPITLYGTHKGMIIDCNYNKDINKAYQEVYNAILSLGGNI